MKNPFWQYALMAALFCFPAAAQEKESLWLEDLTSPEVAVRLHQGFDGVIIPSGGTEQNGPHIALGKHNALVHYTAQKIAEQAGHMLIAPVIAYVPEGAISPPDGHMKFAGTISVRDETFAAVLEDTARSMQAHGFKRIYFLGDHGGNIAPQEQVAEKLTKEWEGRGVKVVSLSDYYAHNGQEEWVKTLGIHVSDPNAHAGFADLSESLAAAQTYVRAGQIRSFKPEDFAKTGVKGDPELAGIEYGRKLLDLKVEAALKQINAPAPQQAPQQETPALPEAPQP